MDATALIPYVIALSGRGLSHTDLVELRNEAVKLLRTSPHADAQVFLETARCIGNLTYVGPGRFVSLAGFKFRAVFFSEGQAERDVTFFLPRGTQECSLDEESVVRLLLPVPTDLTIETVH